MRADLREGDVIERVGMKIRLTHEQMMRLGVEYVERQARSQFESEAATRTITNAAGQLLYLDVDTIFNSETVVSDDLSTMGRMVEVRGEAVYRLPRRSELVTLRQDLHAYPVGSSFLSESHGGLMVALMDASHPMLHIIDPEYRGFKMSIRSEAMPLYPQWQPDVPMTHEEVLRGGYDRYGIPALHRVRIEDKLAKPLYGGAL